jgi:hypothetical protein
MSKISEFAFCAIISGFGTALWAQPALTLTSGTATVGSTVALPELTVFQGVQPDIAASTVPENTAAALGRHGITARWSTPASFAPLRAGFL